MQIVLTSVATSLGLFARALGVVARTPRLFVFALLAFGTLFALGTIAPPVEGPLRTFAFQMMLVTVLTTFEVALARATLDVLEGGKARIGASLGRTAARVPAICTYALVWIGALALYHLLAGDRGHPLLGLAWQVWMLGVFMIAPVLADEQRRGLPSIRRSVELFATSLGQTVLVTFWIRCLFVAAIAVLLLLRGRWAAILFLSFLATFWVLRVVQACVLYRFVTTDTDER